MSQKDQKDEKIKVPAASTAAAPPAVSSGVTIKIMDPLHEVDSDDEFRIPQYCSFAGAVSGPLKDMPPGPHGFLHAVHNAFAQELGVEITPDHVLTTLIQQLALAVKANPDAARKWLSIPASDAKIVISKEIKLDDWTAGIRKLANGVLEAIKGGDAKETPLLQKLIHPLSGTTSVDMIVRQVAMLDATQPFFDYQLETFCGITHVHLTGTVDDWKHVQSTAKDIAQVVNVPGWAESINSELQHFVDAFTKTPDVEHWKSFYKYASQSGGFHITGSILEFFPMRKGYGKYPSRSLKGFGSGVSSVPFTYNRLGSVSAMKFVAGFGSPVLKDGMWSARTGWLVQK
jgi:hypothetical protein